MVKLISGENDAFEVEESVAMVSVTLKHALVGSCCDTGLPVPVLTSETLAKVIEYCKQHVDIDNHDSRGKPRLGVDDKEKQDMITAWDDQFVNVEMNELADLVWAASFLNIRSLLDLSCQAIADYLTSKGIEYIREFLKLHLSSTYAEEEA